MNIANDTLEIDMQVIVSEKPAEVDEQLLFEEEPESESDKRLAMIIRNWDNFPFWFKAKIYLTCQFFYYRHLVWQFLWIKA